MITHSLIFDLKKKNIVAVLCSGVILLQLVSNDESVCRVLRIQSCCIPSLVLSCIYSFMFRSFFHFFSYKTLNDFSFTLWDVVITLLK